jgi:hypothetical protein
MSISCDLLHARSAIMRCNILFYCTPMSYSEEWTTNNGTMKLERQTNKLQSDFYFIINYISIHFNYVLFIYDYSLGGFTWRYYNKKNYVWLYINGIDINCVQYVCSFCLVCSDWCQFQQYFSYIMAISFISGGNRNT